MSRLITPILFFLIALRGLAQCDLSEFNSQWQTDGTIYGTAKVGNNLYFGGSFSNISIGCGNILSFDMNKGGPADPRFPAVTGIIKHIVSDGQGGWIVAGNFTRIGSVTCTSLAHVKSDYTVDPNWLPQIAGPVTGLVSSNGKIYISGTFSHVNGIPRTRLASFDLGTLALNSFSLSYTNWNIKCLAIENDVLYVGGSFTYYSMPQSWTNLARIEISTGTLKAPYSNINNDVNNILVRGNTIIIQGGFSLVFGQARSQVAAFDTMGVLKAFNPAPNGTVNALEIIGNTLVLGGNFTTISSASRNRLAAYNLTNFSLLPWNPGADQEVMSLSTDVSRLYAAGRFRNAGGSSRNNVVAFDISTLALDSFNIMTTNGEISYATISSNRLIAFGNYTSCNQVPRTNLAAINLSDLSVLPWDPSPASPSTNTISAICASGGTVFVGGSFSTICGQSRAHLAAIDTSGNLLPFNAMLAGNRVNALATGADKLFVGGEFTSASGIPVTNFCAYDLATYTPVLTSFTTNGIIRALAYDNNRLYLGGQFTSFNSQTRNYAACIETQTATLLPWNPSLNHFVLNIFPSNGSVYLGGVFTQVNSTNRSYLAQVDSVNGALRPWDPAPNSPVQTIYAFKNKLFIGGLFTSISSSARSYLATYDEASKTLLPIQIVPDNWITSINAFDSTLFVAGAYFNIDGKPRRGLSIYNLFELVPPPIPMTLYATAASPSSIRLSWTKGNGNGYIVLASENAPVNANPINNVSYTADAAFGAGTAINTSNYTVYSGSDTTVLVTGLSQTSTYSFSVFCYNAYGSCIIYSYSPVSAVGIATPVNLLSFRGRWAQYRTELSWEVVSEMNGRGFDIERNEGLDETAWRKIGFVASASNRQIHTHYTFHDEEAEHYIRNGATLYYRLNHSDFNGNSSYSPVVSVSDGQRSQVKVYPTVAGQSLNLDSERAMRSFRILSINGAELQTGVLQQHYTKLDITALQAGIYYIEVLYQDGEKDYSTFFRQ